MRILEDLLSTLDFSAPLKDTVPLFSVLSDYGVHALAGARVVDAALVLRGAIQGANFRQIKGTRRLIMHRDAGDRVCRG